MEQGVIEAAIAQAESGACPLKRRKAYRDYDERLKVIVDNYNVEDTDGFLKRVANIFSY